LKVDGIDYRTVWMEGNSVYFIDQNFLPFQFKIGEAPSFRDSCEVIRTMSVRGAGAIGALAGFAMAQACAEANSVNYVSFITHARKEIEQTRPTARNLFYATEKVFNAGLVSPLNASKEAQKIAAKDAEDSLKIGESGSKLIGNGCNILTHCNAGWLAFVDYGTALSPVYHAFNSMKKIFVYVDETRPRNQGARLTAWELNNAGIPHAIIPDNAAAHYMSMGKIDIVITGADRIAANGDTANKIGTLEKAILASEFRIPFYIAAPTSTFDLNCKSGKEIIIEERSADEVHFMEGIDNAGRSHRVRVSSPGSGALNPAFDVTPAKYITGIITEKGIIHPTQSEIIKLVASSK
jgi:methylthioribose-1-phosphate isomerase